MRALRTGIPLLHIKPESAYPALELAPPIQERSYPSHSQANRHHSAKPPAPSKNRRIKKSWRVIFTALPPSIRWTWCRFAAPGTEPSAKTGRTSLRTHPLHYFRKTPVTKLEKERPIHPPPQKITPQPRVIFTSGKTGQGAGCNNPSIQPRGTKRQIGNACSGNLQGRIHHGAYMKIRMLPHTPDLIRHSGHGHGGERGQRRICGTRRRQSHTHFPGRAGRHRISPNGASHRQRSIAQHILMQARIICRQQHHGTRLISPAADFRHLHMDKKAGGKSANAKKSIHRKIRQRNRPVSLQSNVNPK